MILAIDFSQYLAPPPSLQKKSLGTSDYITFEVPSTHCGKTFDPEAQTVCIGIKDDTSRYSDVRTAWLVLNLKTLVNATSMGVSNALHYLNEL